MATEVTGINQVCWSEAQQQLDSTDLKNIKRFLTDLTVMEKRHGAIYTAVLVGSALTGGYNDVDLLLLSQNSEQYNPEEGYLKDFLNGYSQQTGLAVEADREIYKDEETWQIVFEEGKPLHVLILHPVDRRWYDNVMYNLQGFVGREESLAKKELRTFSLIDRTF
ncbi:MAG TPA: hypothetical protein VLE93_03040 [Candidatus Saccharimonadales bacterium]|nr:hypothetical protein [Candidatus Saccharimonadales bacterium]